MLRSNSKSLGESMKSVLRRKGKAAEGRICIKGRFKPGMKEEWMMEN